MRAALLGSAGTMLVEDVPAPEAGAQDMLVRTLCCGLCGSDLYKIRNRTVPPGTVLGHEIVGLVERCPEEFLTLFPLGSRVTVSNHVPCGQCNLCIRGRISSCRLFRETAVDPGGMAELIRVPPTHIPQGVIPVPASLDDSIALLAEPLGCCLRALERWRPEAGQRIMVVGLGPMGLLMSILLNWCKAAVSGVDPIEERRRIGAEKGCQRVCAPQEARSLGTFRAVVLTVCTPESLDLALDVVEPGGWIGLFAGPPHPRVVGTQLQRFYKEEVDLIPSYSTGPEHMRRALWLLENEALDVRGIVSHDLPIEEAQLAVELAEARVGLKAMLRF